MKTKKPSLERLFQVSEIDIVYKSKVPFAKRPYITESTSAYKAFMSVWDLDKIDLVEQFKIMMLDTASRCIGICDIASGGISDCIVDPRLIFAAALKTKATTLILAHNHPSGNLTPSDTDVNLTQRLVECGNFLKIRVADHLIVSRDNYRSLDQDRLMPGAA